MSRTATTTALAWVLLSGCALVFEVEATVKKVDADKRVLTFYAQQKDRTASVAADAKFFAADGQELKDGLRAKELAEGTLVTLTIEKAGDKPLITAIRLLPPIKPADAPKVDTSKLIPLTDMTKDDKYQGFPGGLYPEGSNRRPQKHEVAGLDLARTIGPLDADGKPSKDGKIVLLGIGFSNTLQAMKGFIDVAAGDKEINPAVVIVNGAVGGVPASEAQKEDGKGPKGIKYWEEVDNRLKAAGVSRNQVQAVWLKETNPAPHKGAFPAYIKELEGQLVRIVQLLAQRFPQIKMVYLSSRTWAGWARVPAGNPNRKEPGNSEPYSYETGFAVKWLIEKQLGGEAALRFEGPERKAPWLSWGPYLWANGEQPRRDGWNFKKSDFRDDDQMHHSLDGMRKLGTALLTFFKTDATTRPWFCRP